MYDIDNTNNNTVSFLEIFLVNKATNGSFDTNMLLPKI